jgi:putative endonuclease
VYVLANRADRRRRARPIYIGVTNDLERRLGEHRTATSGFSARYRTLSLVHLEELMFAADAIAREKEIKGWSRWKKIALIEGTNPGWRDLAGGDGYRQARSCAGPSGSLARLRRSRDDKH